MLILLGDWRVIDCLCLFSVESCGGCIQLWLPGEPTCLGTSMCGFRDIEMTSEV